MNALISAIGLLMCFLIELPTSTKAMHDLKKSHVGRALANAVGLLNTVLARAGKILDMIAQMPVAPATERQRLLVDTTALVEAQLSDLRELAQDARRELSRKAAYTRRFSATRVDVGRILSIYEPDLGNRLQVLYHMKTNLLSELARFLFSELQSIDEEHNTIRDIVRVDPQLHSGHALALAASLMSARFREPGDIDRPPVAAEEDTVEGLTYQSICLKDPEQVAVYTERARARLAELTDAQQQLARLVREHFEPHKIL